MREIEFRGKRIDNGEWVYGNLMQFEDSATFIFADERKGASTLTYAHFIINNMHAIDEKTLGQYTGVKDKNGKKIFERDICWEEHNECYGVVKFEEGKFLYVWENIAEDLWEVADSIEIYGNIHENPELLEGTE
ncbi:YopX family protein [Listeria monocytogenes]|uniref:YopX family protein n=1 Tax=Listeria monocytogenes TaxID=1639 RepID=UPI00390463FC